jgi:hypothetical protein
MAARPHRLDLASDGGLFPADGFELLGILSAEVLEAHDPHSICAQGPAWHQEMAKKGANLLVAATGNRVQILGFELLVRKRPCRRELIGIFQNRKPAFQGQPF